MRDQTTTENAATTNGDRVELPTEERRLAPIIASRPKLQVVTDRPRADAARTPASHRALTLVESIAIVLASLAASQVYHLTAFNVTGPLLAPFAVGLLTAILFGGVMHAIEGNQLIRNPSGREAIRDVTFVWLAAVLAVTFFAFSLKVGGFLSRGAMLSFVALGYTGIVAVRATLHRPIARLMRPSAFMEHQVIVVGAGGDPSLEILLEELRHAGHADPDVVAFRADCAAHEWPRELRRSLDAVKAEARVAAHGEICVAGGGFDDRRLGELIAGLQNIPRAVRVVPTPSVEQFLHRSIRSIGRLHAIEVQRAPLNTGELIVKRSIDIAAAAALFAILAPLLALIAALVKLDSRGSVLFKQSRLGLSGVPFDIYKFRTMTVTENGSDVKQAQRGDARVTRVGHWLRRLSLDEFPQLINVIRGEMSLVGPRPHALAHDKYYAVLIENYELRQHVKPGMTGWAQVNGLRGPTSTPELMRRRVEFDIWYATNASIGLDIKILLLTAVEVFRQRNAH